MDNKEIKFLSFDSKYIYFIAKFHKGKYEIHGNFSCMSTDMVTTKKRYLNSVFDNIDNKSWYMDDEQKNLWKWVKKNNNINIVKVKGSDLKNLNYNFIRINGELKSK